MIFSQSCYYKQDKITIGMSDIDNILFEELKEKVSDPELKKKERFSA